MNDEKDKELDDLFKRRLGDPAGNACYNGDDWDALEQMLDKHKKRRGIVYWLPVMSGAAALLLLFFGWLILRPHTAGNHPQNNPQAVNHPKAHSGTNGGSIRQQTDYSSKTLNAAEIAKNDKYGSNHQSVLPLSAANGSRPATGPLNQGANNDAYTRSGEVLTSTMPTSVFEQQMVAVEPVTVVDHEGLMGRVNGASPSKAAANGKNKMTPKPGYRPQYALSVLAAPDINGVGSFQQSEVGSNEGLLFSAGISKKFTITTGAIYSVKPYITGFENYHTAYQFEVNPVSVSADCHMLDIPLNLAYQLYGKHQNKVSVGTGLSSYIMLHQGYTFNYADGYNAGPTQYNAPGTDKYFFGILNLNATFQHQVNSKVGYSVQPYVKVPLTNIGYSQVKLQTTGVAIGLTWNLNSLSKP